MSKMTKNDLVSIYKLEFYKRKKKWIIPSKASKGSKRDKKQLEKKISEGKINEDSKNSRDPDLVIDDQEVRDLNKTYSVETVNNKSTWNDAFIESGNGLDAAVDNDDVDSTVSPKLMIERTEPVVNYKVFWPQLMLTAQANDAEVLDSNYCFNPYDYQDGDFIKKTDEVKVDFNANIDNRAHDIHNEHTARHYDNGDHEFVNNRFVLNKNANNNEKFIASRENDFENDIDNIFVKSNMETRVSDNCLFQYGSVIANEGMYYENGYDNSNRFYVKDEPKIVNDENYLQNVLMQINNDVNKEQMCLSDRNAMEKYNEIIHEEQIMSHKLNNKKIQNADSYLWNNINNGVIQEMSKVHRPPTVTTINDNNINIEATNQLSKMLLGDKTNNQHDNDEKHENPDVTIVRNKKDTSYNANKTLVYKKLPKISFANHSANECYENLKNYPMPSDLFDGNIPGYGTSSKGRSIYDDVTCYVDDDCSSKNMFMYLNNTKNTSGSNNPTMDFNSCLPKLNSAPSSVSRRSQNSNNYPQNSSNYPQNSSNYPQSPNNYPQNYNNPRNSNINSPSFESDVAPYYVNNNMNQGSRSTSVYSENIRIQCQRVTNNPKIPIPSLHIPPPNLNNTTPNLNTTAPILNSPPPKLDLPLPNFNIPPPNFRSSHENFDPVIKNSVSYTGVNFRWSMNSAPANYFESLHHPLVHGPSAAPCFLNVEHLPKGRGRGRLMKS